MLQKSAKEDIHLPGVGRRLLLAGAVHRLQIRHVRAPDRGSRLGPAAGAGEIHRVDQCPVARQNDTVRRRDGLQRPLPGVFPAVAKPFGQVRLRCPGLAAGAVIAYVTVCMLAVGTLVQRERPGRDGLGLQRCLVKIQRHLTRQHTGQIRLQRHRFDGVAGLQPQGDLRIYRRRSVLALGLHCALRRILRCGPLPQTGSQQSQHKGQHNQKSTPDHSPLHRTSPLPCIIRAAPVQIPQKPSARRKYL